MSATPSGDVRNPCADVGNGQSGALNGLCASPGFDEFADIADIDLSRGFTASVDNELVVVDITWGQPW
jgi:hypothetical protein